MSKKTYLLLALLCASLVLFMAPAFAATQEVQSWDISSENPGWTLEGDWAFGVPLGEGGDPDTGVGKDPPSSVGNVLGTNLEGNYSADAEEFATSEEVDCSGKVGTTLTFNAWLDIQANKFDQATVEVSNGGDWVVVWQNSAEDDTLDTAFSETTVDISAVADNESAVQVRFGLISDGSVEFGGWNINAVAINASADDTTASWLLGGTNDLTADWDLQTGWAVGTPAAANASGQPLASAYADRTGVDPEEANTGTLVLGYVVNGNYARNQIAEFATSPVMDFSGSRAVKLNFFRWLAVEDAASDHASIQVNNDSETPEELFQSDFSDDTIGDYTVSGNGDAVVNTDDEVIDLDGPVRVAAAIDSSEHYGLVGTIDLATDFSTGGATLAVKWTDGDKDIDGKLIWSDFDPAVSLDGANDMDTYDLTLPAQALATDPKSDDNANFQISVVTTGALMTTDTAQIGDIYLEGVKWAYVFQNEASVPPANLFDTEWTEETIDLSEFADGMGPDDDAAVRVRFAMGPTDNFVPGVGQQATEFGGWSIDDIAFKQGTLAWKSVEDSYDFPLAMFWGQDDRTADMTLRNMGTGYWDEDFFVNEVAGPADEAGVGTVADEYADPITSTVVPNLIERYDVGSVNLEDVVDPAATVDISADLVAPPVSTIAYLTADDDGTPTSPGDADTSVTGVNWFFFDMNEEPVPLYLDMLENDPVAEHGPDVPKGLVQISRFPDVQLDADNNPYWARYWIEELAGRVPYVVKGIAAEAGPNIYLPEDVVSRGALAVYIVNAKALPISDPPGFVFKDVPVQGFGNPPSESTYWAAAYIEAVQKAGIVNGIPPDFTTFAPDNPVDRQGMTKFMALGADLPGNGDTAAAVKAEWQTYQDDEGDLPFADVALDIPGTTPGTSVPNPFLPFINACWKADVVQGIASPPGGTFAPLDSVTRSQLAVFVWRAFMREQATAVMIAGPAITGVALSPEVWVTEPAMVAFPTWIGYPQVDTADGWDNSNIAYVALDAMRLGGDGIAPLPGTDSFVLTMELRDAETPTVPAPAERTFTFPLDDAEIATFAADALDAGNPYLTFYQLLPAATATTSEALADPMHGDFVLVTSVTVPSGPSAVKMAESLRQPAYRSYGRFFVDNFDFSFLPLDSTGVDGWKVSGLPATGPVIDDSVTFDDDQGVLLVQTQEMRRHIATTGWQNLNLTFWIAASNLSADDTFAIQYSTDGGVNWNDVDGGTLSDVEDMDAGDIELEEVSVDLPSSASRNPNFWLRVKMTAAGIDNLGWIDNITLKGT